MRLLFVGNGHKLSNASPAGLSLSVGILLPGNGLPVNGSVGVCKFPECGPLKSPFRSRSVGTVDLRGTPRDSRRHSCDQKKKILSFFTGPPIVYPKFL